MDTTFHLGAFENRKLTGVASFYMEGTDAIHSHKQLRMRGMAVDEPDQDLRIGTTVLHKANRILYHGNAEYLWCHAKTSAQPFYERIGFSQIGDAFATKTNDAYVILYKKIEKP
nr:GNAT family N-acetyltransferase [Thalassobacillus pellis]